MNAILGKLGGRKFLVACFNALAIALNQWLGIDPNTLAWLTGLCITYILAQAGADAATGGATSTVAQVNLESVHDREDDPPAAGGGNAAYGAGAVLLLCLLPLLGGCSSEQAKRTTATIGQLAVAYDRDRDAIDEGFIAHYRAAAQAKADELAADAIRAETDAQGRASATNVQAILAIKAEHYRSIEQIVAGIRARIAGAKLNHAALVQYDAALVKYFEQSGNTQSALTSSANDLMDTLEKFLKPKAAPGPAQIVPLP